MPRQPIVNVWVIADVKSVVPEEIETDHLTVDGAGSQYQHQADDQIANHVSTSEGGS